MDCYFLLLFNFSINTAHYVYKVVQPTVAETVGIGTGMREFRPVFIRFYSHLKK